MLIKTSRREWLRGAAYGVGGYALSGLMPGGGWFGAPEANAASFVDPLAPKEGLEIDFRDVRLLEPRAGGNLLAPPCRKVVHNDHPVAVREVAGGHARADEPGTAGDENVHRIS